jgi:hypothetical protein
MEILKMYKEMDVSYREFETILKTLGYKKSIGDNFICFYNKKYDSLIKYAKVHGLDNIVNKAHFLADSRHMEYKGIIEDVHDLAKMIEQMRLEELSEAV